MRRRSLLLAASMMSVVACGGDSDPGAAGERASNDGRDAAVVQQTAATRAAEVPGSAVPDACELIPRAEFERIAGPLDGEPTREGNGCWHYAVADTTTAEWKQIRDGAERARASGMDERAIAMYHPTRGGIYAEVDVRGDGAGSAERPADLPPGWDEASASRSGAVFNGRTGHVRVAVKVRGLRIPPDTVVAIAGRVRDRIPDGPIAHPDAGVPAGLLPVRDPCGVLPGEEAEAVLGKLVADPFRTRDRTPLADPSGASCAYLTSGHRVFVLTPVWNYGGIELTAARMVGGLVSQVADLTGIEGDTLEGSWDEAVVDLTGELLLRKGGRVLGVRYLMSSTDAAGAIRLAEPVLARMAAATDGEE